MVLADSRKASPTPRYSGYCYPVTLYVYGPFTLYGTIFQMFQLHYYLHVAVLQPHKSRNYYGLGCFPFARHYSGNNLFSSGYLDVSVPQVPFAQSMCSTGNAGGSLQRVSPFGNPRVNACSRLPEAYRSDPRPSSALGAKASTVSS